MGKAKLKYNKYPKNAITKIAKHSGLTKRYIYKYFAGCKGAKEKTIFRIQKALDELNIEL